MLRNAPARDREVIVTDPVCGMEVEEPLTFRATFAAHEYSFCSEECRAQFVASPEEYVAPDGSAPRR